MFAVTEPNVSPERLRQLKESFQKATANTPRQQRPAYPTVTEKAQGEAIQKLNEAAKTKAA